MLNWINDRLPTEQDANPDGYVLTLNRWNQAFCCDWDKVRHGQAWAVFNLPGALPKSENAKKNAAELRPVYTTAEAAKLFKCAPQKIRDLIHQGELEAVNTSVGDTRPRWVITAKAIDVFQERRAPQQETNQP